MFGWLWGLGIFGLLVCFLNRRYHRHKIEEFQKNKIQAVTRGRTERENMNGLLAKYIDEVFPVVFQGRSYFVRMIEEITKHHRYINLLLPSSSGSPKDNDLRRNKVVICGHLLTVQTMLMFLLALCYELQVTCLWTSTTSILAHILSSLLLGTVPVRRWNLWESRNRKVVSERAFSFGSKATNLSMDTAPEWKLCLHISSPVCDVAGLTPLPPPFFDSTPSSLPADNHRDLNYGDILLISWDSSP
jgi:hypothetical protein